MFQGKSFFVTSSVAAMSQQLSRYKGISVAYISGLMTVMLLNVLMFPSLSGDDMRVTKSIKCCLVWPITG